VREGHLLKAASRFRHFMKRSFAHRLRARPGSETLVRTEAVGVLCPSYSGSIEGADLEWVRLDAHHLLDLARVSIRALWAGWRNDPTVEIARCTRGEIWSHGIIPAVLDGEPTTFVSSVRIAYDPNGPRVLALAPEAAQEA
jgi:hypothetical protein